MKIFMSAAFLLCWVSYCTALTAYELSKFEAYKENITYEISYNKKLKQDTTVFTSLGLPNYATSEYDEIDRTHPITFRVLTNPVKAASNGCLKQGPIGLALNGVPFLNVYTSTGFDALEAEAVGFDQCGGHVSPNGAYHYHGCPTCEDVVIPGEPDQFIGVALDGFPIYGPYDDNGEVITKDKLNNCNGETYTNDEGETSFRYRLTYEFPYTLGCLYGEPTSDSSDDPFCVMPYRCGPNPADLGPNHPKYEDCGNGNWPEKPPSKT